jgi:hypothetical protein
VTGGIGGVHRNAYCSGCDSGSGCNTSSGCNTGSGSGSCSDSGSGCNTGSGSGCNTGSGSGSGCNTSSGSVSGSCSGGGGGSATLDVSPDIAALALSPSATVVVCAGAKTILDVPKTLEALETAGVPVATLRSDMFPAFYTGFVDGYIQFFMGYLSVFKWADLVAYWIY